MSQLISGSLHFTFSQLMISLNRDANRRLQDCNDMKSMVSETSSEPSSMISRKRGSILGDYFSPNRSRPQLAGHQHLHEMDEEIDSGHSSNIREDDSSRSSWNHYHPQPARQQQCLLDPNCLMMDTYRSKSCDCLYQKQALSCQPSSLPASCDPDTGLNDFSVGITATPDRTFKVIFIGDAGVGKSSFILRVTRNEFVPVLSSTLGVDFNVRTVIVNGSVISLHLWDTAGQERFRSITRTYFRKADGVMLLYDVSNEQSFLNVRKWVQDIEEQTDFPVPVIIVGNKTDLRDNSEAKLPPGKSFVTSEDGCQMSLEANSTFLEVSVKSGDGVNSALLSLIR